MAAPRNKWSGLSIGVLLVACASLASAQSFGNYGGHGSGSDGNYGPPGSSSGSDFGGSGSGGRGGFGAGFDVATATRYRTIHGILAALAFVVLFPLGAIFMRLVPGRLAIWVHAATQTVAYIVFVAAAALGFWMVQNVRIPPAAGGSLLAASSINYHPIIGIVVLAALFFQPFLGLIHHSRFKKLGRRQVWSHLHLWNGRVMIPLGIVNGGLGLRLAGASNEVKIAYAVVAAVMVAIWILLAVISELRRRRASRRLERERRQERKLAGRAATRPARYK